METGDRRQGPIINYFRLFGTRHFGEAVGVIARLSSILNSGS